VPFNRGTGKVKPLCFRDGAELLCSCQHTVVADQRRLADQTERVLGKLAAQLTAIIAYVIAGLGRHRQLMARRPDTLLCSLQVGLSDSARIRAANRFAPLFDCLSSLQRRRLAID
jgi:hypothetical protein